MSSRAWKDLQSEVAWEATKLEDGGILTDTTTCQRTRLAEVKGFPKSYQSVPITFDLQPTDAYGPALIYDMWYLA